MYDLKLLIPSHNSNINENYKNEITSLESKNK